jgi:hypothetical protein
VVRGIPGTLIDGLLFVEGLGWRRSLPPYHFAGNTASLLLPSFRKLGNVPSVPEFSQAIYHDALGKTVRLRAA